MRGTIMTAAGVMLTLCLSAVSAQEVELLPPRSLNRWGIRPGNYSGLAPLGGGRYAVVDDKYPADGFFVFRVTQDRRTGQVTGAVNEGFRGVGIPSGDSPDAEGVAFRAADSTVWVSRESDQRILSYNVRDGRPTGRELTVPETLGVEAIVPNYGFEALTYDPVRDVLWTMTENVLKADGPVLAAGADETACLRLQSFGADGRPGAQYAYLPDLPLTAVKGRLHAIGAVALWAQQDGSLLVMEREADVARRPLRSRTYIHIYKVCPAEGVALPEGELPAERMREMALKKRLVASFSTRMRLIRPRYANYEGLCEGAPLADGRRTLLLIADSQNRYGRRWCHLHDLVRVLVLPMNELRTVGRCDDEKK